MNDLLEGVNQAGCEYLLLAIMVCVAFLVLVFAAWVMKELVRDLAYKRRLLQRQEVAKRLRPRAIIAMVGTCVLVKDDPIAPTVDLSGWGFRYDPAIPSHQHSDEGMLYFGYSAKELLEIVKRPAEFVELRQ